MTSENNVSLIDRIFCFESAIACRTKVFDNHYHSWFEIYYLESGKCNYLIEDTLYEIKAGDMVLIPAYRIHKTAYSTASHSRLLLSLSDSYLPPYVHTLLEGEQAKLLATLVAGQSEVNAITALECYIEGLRTGFKLSLAMSQDE